MKNSAFRYYRRKILNKQKLLSQHPICNFDQICDEFPVFTVCAVPYYSFCPLLDALNYQQVVLSQHQLFSHPPKITQVTLDRLNRYLTKITVFYICLFVFPQCNIVGLGINRLTQYVLQFLYLWKQAEHMLLSQLWTSKHFWEPSLSWETEAVQITELQLGRM